MMQEKEEKKKRILIVTFPGFGYLQGRPLFYFAKKLAVQLGCDVLDIEYREISEEGSVRERAEKSLAGAAEDARAQIGQALRDAERKGQKYEHIFCISKSFGTLVAGSVWEELRASCPVCQMFLTPLPETYTMFARGKACIMASGTADPFMTKEGLRLMETDEKVELMVFPGANHSLENPEDTCESVRNLERIVMRYEEVIRTFFD
ncbi:MAG: hypothetical protein J6B10_07995 [Lachnospiraceae bacterium]|nr:hypothetical protein [Lachnospiraceae bacterium]